MKQILISDQLIGSLSILCFSSSHSPPHPIQHTVLAAFFVCFFIQPTVSCSSQLHLEGSNTTSQLNQFNRAYPSLEVVLAILSFRICEFYSLRSILQIKFSWRGKVRGLVGSSSHFLKLRFSPENYLLGPLVWEGKWDKWPTSPVSWFQRQLARFLCPQLVHGHCQIEKPSINRFSR